MGLVNISFNGLDELTQAFITAGSEAPDVVHQALYEEAHEAFLLSQKVVPVDTGALRSSGTVSASRSGTKVVATITYGGAASGYAIYVHEIPPNSGGRWDTGNKHAPPTRWKFLERPVKEYSKDMESRMRARVIDIIHQRFAIG